eukprot:TRINITY_DN2918_c0_g1_i1.p1 TRINITY_DN2918_c0_g1~~TRINITY_DN2918_c0_g1_i1.p1  ORF type:complete len:640 (-),score=115.45 TRINITY_DN2918_c0_g1_i1:482-2401(-)
MDKSRAKVESALRTSSFVKSHADVNVGKADAEKVGFLLKEGGRWKSVKRRFCVLSSKQHILYYMESPTSEVVTGLIVLENCGVRMLASTESKDPFTFEIYRSDPKASMSVNHKTYRLIASSEEDLRSWIDSIQKSIYNHQEKSQSQDRLLGQLFVKVLGGRDLAIKDFQSSDPYCILHIMGQQSEQHMHTTVQYSTLNPVWNEEFTFQIFSRGAKLCLVMWDEDLLTADDFMGQKVFEIFPTLESEEIVDQWSKLERVKSRDKVSGDVHISLQYMSHENVDESSLDRYQDLIKWLMSTSTELLDSLMNSLESKLDAVSSSLVNLFDHYHQSVRLIHHFSTLEVNSTVDINTLFRTDSIATKMISSYMTLHASQYLRDTLTPCLKRMLQNPKSYEVDPSRVAAGEFIQTNMRNLDEICQQFIDAIIASLPHCPSEIRALCNKIYSTVSEKFHDKAIMAVTGIIFLRFMNPAIVFPDRAQLVHEPIPKDMKRGLILISKVLQNLANGVEFGGKELYLLDMNEFIRLNQTRVIEFLHAIAAPVGESLTPRTSIAKKDAAREIHFIHRIMRQRHQQIVLQLPDIPPTITPASNSSLKLSQSNVSGSCTFPTCHCTEFVTSLGSKRGMAVCGRCGHTAAVHSSR